MSGVVLRPAACAMAAAAALAVAVGGPAVGARQAPAPTGQVFIVQGLPGTQVSVAVDAADPTTGVSTAEIVGPLMLAPGRHELTVQGEDESWQMETTVRVSSQQSLDVVVHRPASPSGRPVVTVYRSPLAPVAQGKGRLLLAHTATVPPADVRVDGAVAFANIANGEFVDADVPAGSHEATLVPTGRRGPALLGPLPLQIPSQTLTSVYAIGRPQDGSMRAVVHRLPLQQRGSAAPGEIRTGSAGLAAGVAVREAAPPATIPQVAPQATAPAAAGPAYTWPTGVLAALVLAGVTVIWVRGRAKPTSPVSGASE